MHFNKVHHLLMIVMFYYRYHTVLRIFRPTFYPLNEQSGSTITLKPIKGFSPFLGPLFPSYYNLRDRTPLGSCK